MPCKPLNFTRMSQKQQVFRCTATSTTRTQACFFSPYTMGTTCILCKCPVLGVKYGQSNIGSTFEHSTTKAPSSTRKYTSCPKTSLPGPNPPGKSTSTFTLH